MYVYVVGRMRLAQGRADFCACISCQHAHVCVTCYWCDVWGDTPSSSTNTTPICERVGIAQAVDVAGPWYLMKFSRAPLTILEAGPRALYLDASASHRVVKYGGTLRSTEKFCSMGRCRATPECSRTTQINALRIRSGRYEDCGDPRGARTLMFDMIVLWCDVSSCRIRVVLPGLLRFGSAFGAVKRDTFREVTALYGRCAGIHVQDVVRPCHNVGVLAGIIGRVSEVKEASSQTLQMRVEVARVSS